MLTARRPLAVVFTPPSACWTLVPDARGFPLLRAWFGVVRPTPCKNPHTAEEDPALTWTRAEALAATLNAIYAPQEVS